MLNRFLLGLTSFFLTILFPAVVARYRVIVKELSKTAFARAELEKIIVDLEKTSTRTDPSLRTFTNGRVSYVQSLVAGGKNSYLEISKRISGCPRSHFPIPF